MRNESLEKSPQNTQNIVRRFGGPILNRLGIHRKTPVQLAVDRENSMIDQRQNAHFHANLFREIKPRNQENMEMLIKLKGEFEQALVGRNKIADRFSLFAHEDYASHIQALDLGETKQPGSHEDVTELKAEYHDLLEALVATGIIEGELPRRAAKPTIHFSFTAGSEFVSATRNRDLFSFVDGERTLSVAKRMTFLMPISAIESLKISEHGALYRRDIRKVEQLIDTQDPGQIIPVRTVYYAKSKPIKSTEE